MKRFAVALAVAVIHLLGSNEVSLAQHKHKHEMKSMGRADSSREQYDTKGSAVVKTMADTISTPRVVDSKVAASIKGIVEHYLQLKNSLANDKTKDAAAAGKEIVDVMGTVDKSLFTADQKKLYADVEDDAREHAEHIGANAGNIEHQREHFDLLSKDVYDLVKAFDGGQVLFKDFCPMYNDKKGAMWLSEIKTIKNPYYGKKMSTCGSVQEELK
ncbi:MAG TPA: DUF3347 domain-containing protein [Bacteroidota bacterium]